MNVADVMTTHPVSCRPSDPLSAAARLMWDLDLGCLPVLDDDDRVIAMITDRDIAMSAALSGRPLSAIAVQEAMSRDLDTAQATQSLHAVEERMRWKQIRRLPVVDGDGKLLGIVTLADIARHFASLPARRRGHDGVDPLGISTTLAAVSQPREHLPA